jgi:predicted HTH transcriptional regulator
LIYQRFRARLREEELMVGMQRIGVPEYTPTAFREAVHNALLHRDYAHLGTVYVRAHGKITRAEAAELCALSKPQAYRLLKRLADRGLLRQAGSGRGAYYEERHGTGE